MPKKKCFKKVKGRWYSDDQINRIQNHNDTITDLSTSTVDKKDAASKITKILKSGIDDPFDSNGQLDVDKIFDKDGLGTEVRTDKERVLLKVKVLSNGLRQLGVEPIDLYNSYETEFKELNIGVKDLVLNMKTSDDVASIGRNRKRNEYKPKKGIRGAWQWVGDRFSTEGVLRGFGSFYEDKRRRLGQIRVIESRVGRQINNLNKFSKRLKLTDAESSQVLDLLQDNRQSLDMSRLPDSDINRIEGLVKEIRLDLDGLSSDLQTWSGRDDIKIEIIEGNKGEYLTRSYEANFNPDWTSKIEGMPQILARGRDTFRPIIEGWRNDDAKQIKKIDKKLENKKDLSNDEIEYLENEKSGYEQRVGEFDSILTDEVTFTNWIIHDFLGDRKKEKDRVRPINETGKIDNSIFKQRNEEIPQSIKDLLGEVKDPFQALTLGVEKMASNLANTQYQRILARVLLDNELFTRTAAKAKEKGYTKKITIGGESNSVLADVLGIKKSTSIWIPSEIEGMFKPDVQLQIKDTMSFSLAAWKSINGFVKMGLTILNPATQIVNLVGNPFFILANGNLMRPSFWRNFASASVRGIQEDIQDLANKQKNPSTKRKNLINIAIEYGILNSSNDIGDLKFFYNNPLTDAASKWIDSDLKDTNVATIPLKMFGKGLKGVKDFAQWSYAFNDNIFKIASLQTELDLYTNAYSDGTVKKFQDITDPELREKVIEKATRIVRDSLPNYDEVWDGVKFIKKNLVVGPFSSFAAETLRTRIKTGVDAWTDMESDNPRVRAIGRTRMASNFAAIVATVILPIVLNSMAGTSDEELEAFDIIAYPWEKSPVLLNQGDGNYVVINIGSYNPLSYITDMASPLGNKLRGRGDDSMASAVGKSMVNAFEPFISLEVGTESLISIISGRDDFGQKIIKSDDPRTFTANITDFMINKLPYPGAIRSAVKYKQARDEYIYVTDKLAKMRRKRFASGTGASDMEKRLEKKVSFLEKRAKDKGYSIIAWRRSTANIGVRTHWKMSEHKRGFAKSKALYRALVDKKESNAKKHKAYKAANKDYKQRLLKTRKDYNKLKSAFGKDTDFNAILKGEFNFSRTVEQELYTTFNKSETAYIKGETMFPPDYYIEEYESQTK